MPPESASREASGTAPGVFATALRRWRRFRGLSARERRLVIRAVVALPLVEIGLRLFGAGRLLRMLERALPKPVGPVTDALEDVAFAETAARSIVLASRGGVTRASCLRRAVLLWWTLRRRRIACELRLGVRREDGEVAAHAWVESGSRAFDHGHDGWRRLEALS